MEILGGINIFASLLRRRDRKTSFPSSLRQGPKSKLPAKKCMLCQTGMVYDDKLFEAFIGISCNSLGAAHLRAKQLKRDESPRSSSAKHEKSNTNSRPLRLPGLLCSRRSPEADRLLQTAFERFS